MTTLELPQVRELDRRDVDALLARNITGRIGFVRKGEIEIRPVSYVYADGCIYVRSAATTLLAEGDAEGSPVGFEVDEIQSSHRWQSVVVRGTLQRLSPGVEHADWMRAIGRLRRLMPDALRERDRLSHRSELFRVHIREATGRAMG